MRKVGATGAAAAGLGYAGSNIMVQRADAIACGGICIGVGIAGAGAAAGWLLRDREVVGSDPPPSGLTNSAFADDAYNTIETRRSVVKSTFVDNQNLIDALPQAAYSKGKLAAIKAINNGETQSNVSSAATGAVDTYQTTLEKNVVKSYNEAANEYETLLTTGENQGYSFSDIDVVRANTINDRNLSSSVIGSATATLQDGTSLNIRTLSSGDPVNGQNGDRYALAVRIESGQDKFKILRLPEWSGILSSIQSKCDTVRNGLITWVSSVYSQVQSGELDPGELLSPAELAQLSSSEEYQLNQAQADLLALNIPTDLENEATISLSQTSGSSTLKGTLGVTSNVTISPGTTIDPTTKSEDYYLTYDTSQAQGAWTAFNSSVDGGILTLTEQPFESVQYTVSTADDETATFGAGAASKNSNGNYEVDLSSQLNTVITTAQTIDYAATTTETNYVTILLDETFTVTKFVASDGSEPSSVTYTEPAQAETDSNYITKQEWADREQKYQNLIDKYKKETAGGGGGGGGGILPDIGLGLPIPGLAVAAAVAAYLIGQD
jgi:hypothetical protein